MASKRSMKEDTVEDLSKKIKLEQKMILYNIVKEYPNIDIEDHEIKKFILIFHILLKTLLNNDKLKEIKALDTEDGVRDTILLVVTKLINLLKGNIDSLKLPKLIKSRLKKLQSILLLTNNIDGLNKNGSKNGSRSKKATATTSETVETRSASST